MIFYGEPHYISGRFKRIGQTGIRSACCSSSEFNKSLRRAREPCSEAQPGGILDGCLGKCSQANKPGGDAFPLSPFPVDQQRHPVWIASRENRNARETYCSQIQIVPSPPLRSRFWI